MTNLYTILAKNQSTGLELSSGEVSSVTYHDIFDYPLNFSELIKWKVGEGALVGVESPTISDKNGYFFLEGRSGLVYKRVLRKRISDKKMEIAKRAAGALALLPPTQFIGVTGSLAMENSGEDGDIDLILITKRRMLWSTRLLVYLLLGLRGIPFRRAGRREEKNRLCLNMWLDEGDLAWPKKDRNIYTAHEIAQIKPLVNKNHTHEKLLQQNKWILKYWPNAAKIRNFKSERSHAGASIFEWLAYKLQVIYMKPKMTREVVTSTRAVFHPQDWGSVVSARLKQKYGFL